MPNPHEKPRRCPSCGWHHRPSEQCRPIAEPLQTKHRPQADDAPAYRLYAGLSQWERWHA